VIGEGRGVSRSKARRGGDISAARSASIPETWQLILKPLLRADLARSDAVANLRGHGIEGLGKDLAGNFVLEHVGSGIEVHAGRKVPPEAADVSRFEDQLTGQAPLDGEVNHVTSADVELRVILEAQNLAEGRRGHNRRLQRTRSGGRRNLPIHADAEDIAAGS